MPLVLRLVKQDALTYQELDDNFIYLSSSYVGNDQTSSFIRSTNTGSFVKTINGKTTTDGTISISLSATKTGTSQSLIDSGSGNITSSIADGLVWIVANNSPDPTRNGESYIYSSASIGRWFPLDTLNQTSADIRYVRIVGNSTIDGSLAVTSSRGQNLSISSSGLVMTGSTILTGSQTFIGSTIITGSLDVSGSIRFRTLTTSSVTLTNVLVLSSSGQVYYTASSAVLPNLSSIISGSVSASVNVGNGNVFNVTSASTNLMAISSSGNVGIGTISPAYKLDVSGSVRITGSLNVTEITSSATSLTLQQTGDTYGTTQLQLVNRNTQGGAFFKNLGIDLVDFGFITSTSAQGNLRFEHRTSNILSSNTTGEFQLLIPGSDAVPYFQTGYSLTSLSKGNLLIGTTTDSGYKLNIAGDTIVSSGSLYISSSTIYYGIANYPPFNPLPLKIIQKQLVADPNNDAGMIIGANNTVPTASFAIVMGGLNESYTAGVNTVIGHQNYITGSAASATGQITMLGWRNKVSGSNRNGTNPGAGHIVIGQRNISDSYSFGQNTSILIGQDNNTNGYFGNGMIGTGLKYYANRQLLFGTNAQNVDSSLKEVWFGRGVVNELNYADSENGAGSSVSINVSKAYSGSDATYLPNTSKPGGSLTLNGGQGTGTGSAGDVIIGTPITGSSNNTTHHTQTNRVWVKGHSGYVGIGTASPSSSLDIAATTSNTFRISGVQANGSYTNLLLITGSAIGDGLPVLKYDASTGGSTLSIRGTGDASTLKITSGQGTAGLETTGLYDSLILKTAAPTIVSQSAYVSSTDLTNPIIIVKDYVGNERFKVDRNWGTTIKTGGFGNALTLTGSIDITGSAYFRSLVTSSTAITRVLMTDNNGQLYITASSAFAGGTSTPAFPYDGTSTPATISGSLVVSGSGIVVTGSLKVSGSITGSLFGSSSYALTASYALNGGTGGGATSFISTGSVSASVSVGTASFQITSGSSTFMFVSNSGNIGIGTTTPSVKLDISGSTTTTNTVQFGTIGIQSYTKNNAWFGDNVYYNGTFFIRREAGYTGLFYFAGNEGQFRWGSDGNKGAATTNGNSGTGLISLKTNLDGTFAVGDLALNTGDYTGATFFVTGSGNVGIGTTTPTVKLHVAGDTLLSGSLTVSGSTKLTGSISATLTGSINLIGQQTITGSLSVTGSITGSKAYISSSGNQQLTLIGSGSSNPIFTVQGYQSELFSVWDSLSGSLFSVNDVSGLPILEVFSDNTTLMGNSSAPALYTTVRTTVNSTDTPIFYTVPTASYDGMFVDYTIRSGSTGRVGTIMTMWSGSATTLLETSASSFGTTTGFKFMSMVTGSNLAITGSATTNGWTVKTIIRSI